MRWIEPIVHKLEAACSWGYHANGPSASEPAALTAMALLGHDRPIAAEGALEWLKSIQTDEGHVGITGEQSSPRWPTSLAVLAWNHHRRLTKNQRYAANAQQGLDALLSITSHTSERTPNVAHDTTIAGWPWAEGTHAWIEPTAFALMALNASGLGDHQRALDAVRLLLDRQLPRGGCNYGNTFVLGQQLLPHLQPTGLSALALAGIVNDPRLQNSLRYLESFWRQESGTASRAYAVRGLAAHGRTPDDLVPRFEKSAKPLVAEESGVYRAALVALAVLGDKSPLVTSQLFGKPEERLRKESA